jgi:hypothetical protein
MPPGTLLDSADPGFLRITENSLTRPMRLTRDGSRTWPDQLTCPDYLTCNGYLPRRQVDIPGTPAGQYYSGPYTGSVCQSGDRDIFSTGNDVHASGKCRDIAVLLKMERFNPRLNLQNSGLSEAPIF